jgi:hypothetical protein
VQKFRHGTIFGSGGGHPKYEGLMVFEVSATINTIRRHFDQPGMSPGRRARNFVERSLYFL